MMSVSQYILNDLEKAGGFSIFVPPDEAYKDDRHAEFLRLRIRCDRLGNRAASIYDRKLEHLRAAASADERITEIEDEIAEIRAKLASWGY